MLLRIRQSLDSIGRDVRYGVRGLRKSATFTLAAVVTLGLGIGANSAVFTVVNAVLLKGLPYRDAGRLVHIWETEPKQQMRQVSFPDFKDVRDGATSFESVAGYAFDAFTLKTSDGSERVSAARVSANFFSTLGVEPALGRSFRTEEDQPLRQRDVVVLAHGFWQRRFGGDPGIVGRSLSLSGAALTVIGVLPADFHFARVGDPDIFVTLSPAQAAVERRFMHWMWAFGRLRDGVTEEAAGAELAAVAAARAQADQQWHKETGLRLMPLREALVGPIRPVVLGLFGAVGAVLLIACANVANMLLARAMSRKKEVGIRLAMGASRFRIASQFLTESVVLALVGGGLGLLWAGWGVRALVAAIPANQLASLPFLRGLQIEPGVLAFTFAVCLGTGVLFGLAPALRSSAGQLVDSLKDGARGSSGRQRLRSALVVSEVAIALSLVAATGLLARSLSKLLEVNPGFETRDLVTARVAIPGGAYDTPEKIESFFDQWQSRIQSLPGVSGVALVDLLPLMGSGNTGTPSIVGMPGDSTTPDTNLRTVSENYFSVMGLRGIAGRMFAASDRMNSPRVVMVNQAFVDEVLKGREAVGQHVTFAFNNGALEIVGVVANEKVGLLDARVRPVLYFPSRQAGSPSTSIVVRGATDVRAISAALRTETLAMEPDAIVTGVRTMEEIIAASPATFLRRYPLLVLSCFAGLALILAAIGIYGVMSLAVRERTSEIGIRMALGASASSVLRLVLRQGVVLASLGVVCGLAAGLSGSRLLSSALFEIPATDPVAFGAAAVILMAVAVLACWIPASRAARVDPLAAVRHE